MKKKPKNAEPTPAVERPTSIREKDAGMSALDVKSLATEELPRADFPATLKADFRVVIDEPVHQGIWKHATESLSVEICGVLVGLWHKDDNGPYASITQFIRCDGATQKFAEVTFTHESWAQINKEMDSKYQDLRIIGWYHSHPNFGIFLSDRDGFIQQNFFSGAGQIALVVDPVRKIEGIFVWRKDKTAPLAHFWVGDKIKMGAGFGTQDEAMTQKAVAAAMPAGNATTTAATAAPPQRDLLGSLLNLLIGILLFLCGFFFAAKMNMESLLFLEGAVRQRAAQDLMTRTMYKPDFEDRMRRMIERQQLLQLAVAETGSFPPPKDEKEAAALAEQWKKLAALFQDVQSESRNMLRDYGLNEREKAALAQAIGEEMVVKESGAKDHVPQSQKAGPEKSTPTGTGQTGAPRPAPLRVPPEPTSTSTPAPTPAATTPPPSAPAAASTAPAPTTTAPATTPAPAATTPPPAAPTPATPTTTPPTSTAPAATATAPAAVTGPAPVPSASK